MEQDVVGAVDSTVAMLGAYVPNLVGALAVLVIGWIAASWIARGVRAAVRKFDLAQRVSNTVTDIRLEDARRIEDWIGRGIFIILILFVLVAFFQVLGLNQVTEPLMGFLNQIFQYLPRLIGPALLLVIAWLVAKFLRLIVQRGLARTRLDEKVGQEAGIPPDQRMSLAETAGTAVYWLTFLIFTPAILSSLELGGLLEPVRTVVDELLGYLPNLLAAAVILFVGWLVARVVRRIVTNLMLSINADALSQRVGLHAALGRQSISSLTGLVVYVLILIPVIVAALNALELEAVTAPASLMLHEILDVLPNLFAATVLLIVAYVIARMVASLTTGVLANVGFDTLPERLGLSRGGAATGRTASEIAGFVVMVAILLFAIVEAFKLVGFVALAALVSEFLVFAGHVVVGLFVIGLGLFLANVVAGVIVDSRVQNARFLALIARIAILVLATAMGLGEMGLGEDVIEIAFGLTLGAIAVALAIAFGIGGRDVAGRIVADWAKDLKLDNSGPGGAKRD